MHQTIRKSSRSQQGAVLLEALISILILSLGILALVGLQARMIENTTNSKMRADAAYFAQQQIGLMWANPAGNPVTTDEDIAAAARLPGGLMTITQPTVGQFEIRIGWTAPSEAATVTTNARCGMTVAHCFVTTAMVVGG